jgi:hypothetical protein
VTLKLGTSRFNGSAMAITGLFLFYMAALFVYLLLVGPFATITTFNVTQAAGATAVFAEAVVGLRASRMFGGWRNFTGRLLAYYAVALFVSAISWIVWGVLAQGQIPTGFTLAVIGIASTTGEVLSCVALFSSARSIFEKFDRRAALFVVASLFVSAVLSVLVWSYQREILAQIIYGAIWPAAIFVQLSCGLIVVSLLGRWYLAGPIKLISSGYIVFSIAIAVTSILQITLNLSPADFWVGISIIESVSFFVIGLGMSQALPKSFRPDAYGRDATGTATQR